jgi:hypothetical protein
VSITTSEASDETRVKHCCALCGAVISEHVHVSWEDIKECLKKNPVICRNCKETR